MKKKENNTVPDFGWAAFFKAIIPSYIVPLVMSFQGGYFSNNAALMKASYSTIAIPSLLSTVICFLLLKQFQKNQFLIINKIVLAFILSLVIGLIVFIAIVVLRLQVYAFDIMPSAMLGPIIATLTNPLKKINHCYEK